MKRKKAKSKALDLVLTKKCPVCRGKGAFRVAFLKLDISGKVASALDANEGDTSDTQRHDQLEICPVCHLKGWMEAAEYAMFVMACEQHGHKPGDQLAGREGTKVWIGNGWHTFKNPYYVMYVQGKPQDILPT